MYFYASLVVLELVIELLSFDISGMQAVGYSSEEDIEDALKNNQTLYSATLAALVFDPVDLNQQRYSESHVILGFLNSLNND